LFRSGANQIFARKEAANAVGAAVVGLGVAGERWRLRRAVGIDFVVGDADLILIPDVSSDRGEPMQAQLEKRRDIFGEHDGHARRVPIFLAVFQNGIVGARGGQQVDSRAQSGESKLSGAVGPYRGFAGYVTLDDFQRDHRPGERMSCVVVEDDAPNRGGVQAMGCQEKREEPIHRRTDDAC
jgi:hypothetical protein